MAIRIGETVPNFTAATTDGEIDFHEWLGDSWGLLFSHPKDFTPICTTELGAVAGLKPEFDKRNTKVIGVSVDPVSDHERWAGDIETATGNALNYPLIGDTDLNIAKLYDMLPAGAGESSEGRTPVDNATVRTVFIIGPDKKLKASLTYPMSTGRNFDEIVRVIDSVQLTDAASVSTPANWKPGDDVVIPAALSDEDAAKKYPEGVDKKLPYLRFVKQPSK